MPQDRRVTLGLLRTACVQHRDPQDCRPEAIFGAGAVVGFDLMTASLGGPIRQVQNGLTALRVDQHEQAPHFSAKNEPPLGLYGSHAEDYLRSVLEATYCFYHFLGTVRLWNE
jgi:hypothetical protein